MITEQTVLHKDSTYVLLLLVVLCVPFFAVTYPQLLDYPNHLSRIFIETHQNNPYIAQYYDVNLTALPNLAFDAIAYPLSFIIGIPMAGKVFILLSVLLMASAPLALSYALNNGRINPLSLIGTLFVYNLALQKGFLGFVFSVGLAIWLFSFLYMLRGRTFYYVAGLIFPLILFFCHLYAFTIYCILFGSVLVGELFDKEVRFKKTLTSGVLFALLATPVLVIYFKASPTSGAEFTYVLSSIPTKLSNLAFSLFSSPRYLAILNWPVILFCLVYVVIAAGKKYSFPFHNRMTFAVMLLAALYPIMPEVLASSANADWRLLIPLALIASGSLKEVPFTQKKLVIFKLALLGIVLVNVSAFHFRLQAATKPQEDMISAVNSLPFGAKVLPMYIGGTWKRPPNAVGWTHLASFGVMERQLFLPTTFAFATQQPIAFDKRYKDLAERTDDYVFPQPEKIDWAMIRKNYDYIINIDPDGNANRWAEKLPNWLSEVTAKENFVVYKVSNETGFAIAD